MKESERIKLEYIDVSELKPYKNNARKHTKDDIKCIMNSIEQFGMNDPIGIWSADNIIVEGHGRLQACIKLGYDKVPCIRLDSLTDEERKAYTLAHNKTAENSSWDFEKLNSEILEIEDIDMSGFGFDFDEVYEGAVEAEEKHIEAQESTQEKVENILNLGIAQFASDNKYDFPELEPVYELPEITEWIGFNYVLTDENPKGKAVHFFIDDYQFERIWNNPDKYVEKLKQYVCVATPDFSPYGDMPLITQMWNHYRKHWVGAYLQSKGVTVIPTIRCSTDERSLEWYLMGEPKNGIVIMSSMWTEDNDISEISKQEYENMKNTLNPKKIYIYGGKGNMEISDKDNVEFIENFAQKRWNKDA